MTILAEGATANFNEHVRLGGTAAYSVSMIRCDEAGDTHLCLPFRLLARLFDLVQLAVDSLEVVPEDRVVVRVAHLRTGTLASQDRIRQTVRAGQCGGRRGGVGRSHAWCT